RAYRIGRITKAARATRRARAGRRARRRRPVVFGSPTLALVDRIFIVARFALTDVVDADQPVLTLSFGGTSAAAFAVLTRVLRIVGHRRILGPGTTPRSHREAQEEHPRALPRRILHGGSLPRPRSLLRPLRRRGLLRDALERTLSSRSGDVRPVEHTWISPVRDSDLAPQPGSAPGGPPIGESLYRSLVPRDPVEVVRMSRRSEMIRITAASLVPRRGLACIAMRPPHGDSDPRLGAVSVRKHIPESRRFDVEHPLADLGLRRLGPRRIMHRTTIKCRSSSVVRVTMVQTCDLARNGGLFTRYPRRTLAFEGFDLDARGAILAIRGENNLWLEVEMSRCRAFAHSLILCSLVAGCEEEEDDSAPLGATEERIIGGFPARSPSLNAVGAIGFPTYSEDFGNDLDTSLSRRRYIDRRMQIGERSSY